MGDGFSFKSPRLKEFYHYDPSCGELTAHEHTCFLKEVEREAKQAFHETFQKILEGLAKKD
jgi:hypothetical protein